MLIALLRLRRGSDPAACAELRSVLASRPGCLDAQLAVGVDDPDDRVVVSRWADLGSCRRGVGSADVRLVGMALIDADGDHGPFYEVETGAG